MTIGPLLLFVEITIELMDFMYYQNWPVKVLVDGVQGRLRHNQMLHDGRSIMHASPWNTDPSWLYHRQLKNEWELPINPHLCTQIAVYCSYDVLYITHYRRTFYLHWLQKESYIPCFYMIFSYKCQNGRGSFFRTPLYTSSSANSVWRQRTMRAMMRTILVASRLSRERCSLALSATVLRNV